VKFFTSDTHFGHANIIKYCKRPFATVDEMTEGLVTRWNETVTKQDEVYFLGDFALGMRELPAATVCQRLNGIKHWVFGNHDTGKMRKTLMPFFASSGDLMEVHENGLTIVLCHYPLYRWNKAQFGSWMLHGHSHGQLSYSFDAKICDVSTDKWDWKPVTIEQIRPRMESKPVVFETDRTEVR
jgi:calcineurin-like phosphoesterase family protein